MSLQGESAGRLTLIGFQAGMSQMLIPIGAQDWHQ